MRKHLTKALSDPFLRNNAVFFIGSLLVSFLNYLYHPVLSHIISVESFGDVETLLVIYAQIGIVLGIFGKIVINEIAHAPHGTPAREIPEVLDLYSLGTILFCSVAALLILFAFPLTAFFHFTSPLAVVMLALLIVLSTPYSFQTATLQGSGDFKLLSTLNAVVSGGKLLFAILFIELGFGVTGAILGLVAAQIAGLLYAHFTGAMKSHRGFGIRFSHLPKSSLLKRQLPYALLILAATACTSVLAGASVVVVKSLFDPTTAGLFSGISVISTIALFVTGSISGVLLPAIKRTSTKAENHASLVKAILLTTFIGGGVLVMFTIIPALIIKLFLGASFVTYSGYLPLLTLIVFVLSLANLFISFFLSLRNYRLIPLSLIGIGCLAASIALYHGSVSAIIFDTLFASLVTLVLLLLLYLYDYYYSSES